MEDAAVALVGLIGTFPQVIQISIVFLILIGGLLFLGKIFFTAIRGNKFDMPTKKRKKK